MWKVRFLGEEEIKADRRASAPKVYTLPDDIAQDIAAEEEERKRKQQANKSPPESSVALGPAYR